MDSYGIGRGIVYGLGGYLQCRLLPIGQENLDSDLDFVEWRNLFRHPASLLLDLRPGRLEIVDLSMGGHRRQFHCGLCDGLDDERLDSREPVETLWTVHLSNCGS